MQSAQSPDDTGADILGKHEQLQLQGFIANTFGKAGPYSASFKRVTGSGMALATLLIGSTMAGCAAYKYTPSVCVGDLNGAAYLDINLSTIYETALEEATKFALVGSAAVIGLLSRSSSHVAFAQVASAATMASAQITAVEVMAAGEPLPQDQQLISSNAIKSVERNDAIAAPRVLQEVASLCHIGSLFQHLTAITTNPACRHGCNDGSGDCPSEWYPSRADSCNIDCGKIFEPFWDECGEMLTEAQLGGMDEMFDFYDNCLLTLYPPGSCGVVCNQHSFDCLETEVKETCCDEGGQNCVDGIDVPKTCPIGCAVVFPQFFDMCKDQLQHDHPESFADYEAFAEGCLSNDGVELIEFLIEIRRRGCVINFDALDGSDNDGHRRFLQALAMAGWLPITDEGTCPWDVMDDLMIETNTLCCGEDGALCPQHEGFSPPESCFVACAVATHEFMSRCGPVLSLLNPGNTDTGYSNLVEFEAKCVQETQDNGEAVLNVLKTAACPSDDEHISPSPAPAPAPAELCEDEMTFVLTFPLEGCYTACNSQREAGSSCPRSACSANERELTALRPDEMITDSFDLMNFSPSDTGQVQACIAEFGASDVYSTHLRAPACVPFIAVIGETQSGNTGPPGGHGDSSGGEEGVGYYLYAEAHSGTATGEEPVK
jgi:hypothetical protein